MYKIQTFQRAKGEGSPPVICPSTFLILLIMTRTRDLRAEEQLCFQKTDPQDFDVCMCWQDMHPPLEQDDGILQPIAAGTD